jgi:hypothetical protein
MPISNTQDIRAIFDSHCIEYRDGSEWLRIKAAWRGGDGWNISVSVETGFWFDYADPTDDGKPRPWPELAGLLGIGEYSSIAPSESTTREERQKEKEAKSKQRQRKAYAMLQTEDRLDTWQITKAKWNEQVSDHEKQRWNPKLGKRSIEQQERDLTTTEMNFARDYLRRRNAEAFAEQAGAVIGYGDWALSPKFSEGYKSEYTDHYVRRAEVRWPISSLDTASSYRQGHIIAIQRETAGGHDGKKYVGSILGGAMLVPARQPRTGEQIVILAEGTMTLKSCLNAYDMSDGLCLFDANNLEHIHGEYFKNKRWTKIIIAGDNDESGKGQRAAHEAARRIKAVVGDSAQVKVAIPPCVGDDWDDIEQACRWIEQRSKSGKKWEQSFHSVFSRCLTDPELASATDIKQECEKKTNTEYANQNTGKVIDFLWFKTAENPSVPLPDFMVADAATDRLKEIIEQSVSHGHTHSTLISATTGMGKTKKTLESIVSQMKAGEGYIFAVKTELERTEAVEELNRIRKRYKQSQVHEHVGRSKKNCFVYEDEVEKLISSERSPHANKCVTCKHGQLNISDEEVCGYFKALREAEKNAIVVACHGAIQNDSTLFRFQKPKPPEYNSWSAKQKYDYDIEQAEKQTKYVERKLIHDERPTTDKTGVITADRLTELMKGVQAAIEELKDEEGKKEDFRKVLENIDCYATDPDDISDDAAAVMVPTFDKDNRGEKIIRYKEIKGTRGEASLDNLRTKVAVANQDFRDANISDFMNRMENDKQAQVPVLAWLEALDMLLQSLREELAASKIDGFQSYENPALLKLLQKIPEAAKEADGTVAESVSIARKRQLKYPRADLLNLKMALKEKTVWLIAGEIHYSGQSQLYKKILKGNSVVLDATPSLRTKAEFEAKQNHIERISIAQSNVRVIQKGPKLYSKSYCTDSKNIEANIEEIMQYMTAVPLGEVAVLTHKSLAREIIDRFDKLKPYVGWWGRDDRAHNRWRNCKQIVIWGFQILAPDVARRLYAIDRAAMLRVGVAWSEWDGSVEENVEVEIAGGHIVRSTLNLPTCEDARKWLLDRLAIEVSQTIGRLRAVQRSNEALQVVIHGAVPILGHDVIVNELQIGSGRARNQALRDAGVMAEIVQMKKTSVNKLRQAIKAKTGVTLSDSTTLKILQHVRRHAKERQISEQEAASGLLADYESRFSTKTDAQQDAQLAAGLIRAKESDKAGRKSNIIYVVFFHRLVRVLRAERAVGVVGPLPDQPIRQSAGP